jgi:tetratricopeptide (TPR) repeat protein
MRSKKWKIVLSIFILISSSFFYFYNYDAFYLNNLLFLLSFSLIPYILNLLEKKIDFSINKILYFSLIFIYFLIELSLFSFISQKKEQVDKLKNLVFNKNQILTSLKNINNSNFNLSQLDSIWKGVKSKKKFKKEFEIVSKNLYNRILNNAQVYINEGNYNNAIDYLNYLVENNLGNQEVYFLLASSYLAISSKSDAIINFKKSADLGNSKAAEFYEKLNPLKKKLSGYVTLCCDGSYSYSNGRGSCSWHGGVCQWDYPIYENFREY